MQDLHCYASGEDGFMSVGWKDTDGTVAAVEEFQTRGGPVYRVVFTYKAGDSWEGGTFTTRDSYRKDDLLTVQYDPLHPERNNHTEREKKLRWLYLAFFTVLASAILYGMLH